MEGRDLVPDAGRCRWLVNTQLLIQWRNKRPQRTGGTGTETRWSPLPLEDPPLPVPLLFET